ncbi:unnamed protein product [Rhizoctonia solani]|uniref:Uncharacterized protein n=1 Tax=Rhizoctonia solani TaxID=456999 RepID=A0A8H3HWS1_9AGAM|nr:unnamed protein product [Rhizoctonia solani]
MSSEESFTHVSPPPSSSGHRSIATQNPGSPSRAPNPHDVKYVRVGRGIVPVSTYENKTSRGRATSVTLATNSAHDTEGEMGPGGTPKQKWYKQAFSRPRYLSFQGSLSRRNTSSTSSSEIPPTIREAEPPIISVTPTRLDVNEPGRKLRKSRSRSPLPPVQPINRPNLASTPPPRTTQSIYVQSSDTYDEEGQLLLDLYGVNENPPAPPPATEQIQPTPEPEPEPEPILVPPPVRRLPPVPVLNVVPPHDSQDSFAYVFGPNNRTPYTNHRGPAAPPPYIARQSAVMDQFKLPPELVIPPEQKREVALPTVAPLSIRRKERKQGGTRR